MNLNEYQEKASKTAGFQNLKIEPLVYLTLGIVGESGEIAEKIKKLMRNNEGVLTDEIRESLKLELGDVLWYLSQFAKELNFTLDEVAEANIKKLYSRLDRGVIKSTGDHR